MLAVNIDQLFAQRCAGAVAGALHAYDGVRRFSLPMSDAPAARASVPKARQKVVPPV